MLNSTRWRTPFNLLVVAALVAAVLLLSAPQTVQAAGTTITLENIAVTSVDCGWSLGVTLDIVVDVPGAGDMADIRWVIEVPGSVILHSFPVFTAGPGPTTATDPGHGFLAVSPPPLPPNSPITFRYRDLNSPAEAGLTVDCSTGAILKVWSSAAIPDGVAGPDMVPIPDTAVGGRFTQTTTAYFAPDPAAASDVVMEAGKTVWVYGLDSSGQFYQVMLSGRFFWVPVGTIGPNYDEVWNGTPLPTTVVE